MEELIDQFDVMCEDGETRRLYVYEQIIDAGTFDDPDATIRGLKRIEDEDGNGVNYLGQGQYDLIGRGVRGRGKVLPD